MFSAMLHQAKVLIDNPLVIHRHAPIWRAMDRKTRNAEIARLQEKRLRTGNVTVYRALSQAINLISII